MLALDLPDLLGGRGVDPLPSWRALRAPALVVWGDDDKIVPKGAGERYAKSLRDARFEIVGGCGHCVDMEQPEALARLVTPFIEQN